MKTAPVRVSLVTGIMTRTPDTASLVSVGLTSVAIAVHHMFAFGGSAFVLGGVLVGLAVTLFAWSRRSAKVYVRAGFALIGAWIVVGFGLFEGFWRITLPIFLGTLLASLSSSYPKPVFGPFWFEISGVTMFLGSVFVLWLGTSAMPTRWRPIRRAALIAFAYMMCAATFAVATRDVWVPPPQGVVKIAVFVPTEGPYALLGDSFVKAVRMAHDDLKNTKYRYELVVGDSSADPRLAEERVRRLLDVEDIDAVVGGISLIGQVTKRHTTAARIPHLCVCTVMWIGDGGYNFTNIPSPEAEAALWAHEAQRRGVKTVAFITQDYPSINNHVKTVKLEAARVGIKVTDEQRLDGSVTDFRSPISRAQRVSPDVYYIEALEPSLSALGRELSRAGIRNISSVVTPSLSDRPELFEGAWYTDSNLRDLAFKRRFEEKYPATRFATHMMPYAYDSVNMIVRAFESEQNPAVYLRKLQAYDGTAGPLTKARASGNFASTPAVWAIANGKPVLLHH